MLARRLVLLARVDLSRGARSAPRRAKNGEAMPWTVGNGPTAGSKTCQRREIGDDKGETTTNATTSSLLRETITSRMHHWRPSRAASDTQSMLQRKMRMPSVRLRAFQDDEAGVRLIQRRQGGAAGAVVRTHAG